MKIQDEARMNRQPCNGETFRLSALCAALAALPLLPQSAQAVDGISELGTLISTQYSIQRPTGISSDGTVVVGYSSGDPDPNPNMHIYHAFSWTSGSMTDLGTLTGPTGQSRAMGISANGSVVVGVSNTSNADEHAVYWTGLTMTDIDGRDGKTSWAYAASSDGSLIVGIFQNNASAFHAFSWTLGTGMVDLGTLGGSTSTATAVSGNGSVIVGNAALTGDSATHAFRYTSSTMTDLGTLGGTNSYGRGVSADGSVVVGMSYTGGDAATRAFRWTQAGGMVNLGTLGGNSSDAGGISGDGNVVVGGAQNVDGVWRAVRWTQGTGMQSVEDWLRASGVTVASDLTYGATATNSDGSVVVGILDTAHHNLAFIARVTGSGGGGDGDGLLELDADTATSLASSSAVVTGMILPQSVVVNGAHSRPLSYRTAAGQKTFWAAGDWGQDNHGSRDGDVGLAEFGVGYNHGTVQVNAALGRTWANQNLVLNGDLDAKGTYLMVDAMMPIKGNLWGVLSGYYNWGDADIRRGYLNAGNPDFSNGGTDTQTWSLRARLEWDGVASLGDASLSPYGELSYVHASMDAYTETGGGFPATYERRTDHATDLRIGLHGAKPISGSTKLLGMLEAVHRFEGNGAAVNGEVSGAFSFSLPGQQYDQNWLRAGIGVESNIAGGTATLMLNATTEGQMPNVWLAARYQRTF